MRKAINTPRPLAEWSLEETLYGIFTEGTKPSEGLREMGAPNVAGWFDFHLDTIDELLNGAGVPLLSGSVHPHRQLGLRVIDGEAS